jgi:hypothetical protein
VRAREKMELGMPPGLWFMCYSIISATYGEKKSNGVNEVTLQIRTCMTWLWHYTELSQAAIKTLGKRYGRIVIMAYEIIGN